jgi:hypothetical protein
MADEPQNYANHRRTDYLYITGSIFALIGLLIAVWGLKAMTLQSFGYFCLCVGIACGYYRLRTYSLIVQDRVIMLEMRVRLDRVLTGDIKSKIPQLTRRQLIGLRFASDAELPALVEKTLKENLAKADDIKKLVKDWQADNIRI